MHTGFAHGYIQKESKVLDHKGGKGQKENAGEICK